MTDGPLRHRARAEERLPAEFAGRMPIRRSCHLAVLGPVDGQELYDEAQAYDELVYRWHVQVFRHRRSRVVRPTLALRQYDWLARNVAI